MHRAVSSFVGLITVVFLFFTLSGCDEEGNPLPGFSFDAGQFPPLDGASKPADAAAPVPDTTLTVTPSATRPRTWTE